MEKFQALVYSLKHVRRLVAWLRRRPRTEQVHSLDTEERVRRIRSEAERYYRNGDYFCSEAVVKAVRDELGLPLPDEIISLASGFPLGMGGSGCTCGAVAGGVMALGMFFGRTNPGDKRVKTAMRLAAAAELHEGFKNRHRSVCCRVLTKGHKIGSREHLDQCRAFTGEVAEETARIILRELGQRAPAVSSVPRDA